MKKSILAATALVLGCSSASKAGQDATVLALRRAPTTVVLRPCAHLEVENGGMADRALLPAKAMDLYRRYVKGLASLAGASDREADRVASSVIDLETQLVQAALDRVSLVDPARGCPLAEGDRLARSFAAFGGLNITLE